MSSSSSFYERDEIINELKNRIISYKECIRTLSNENKKLKKAILNGFEKNYETVLKVENSGINTDKKELIYANKLLKMSEVFWECDEAHLIGNNSSMNTKKDKRSVIYGEKCVLTDINPEKSSFVTNNKSIQFSCCSKRGLFVCDSFEMPPKIPRISLIIQKTHDFSRTKILTSNISIECSISNTEDKIYTESLQKQLMDSKNLFSKFYFDINGYFGNTNASMNDIYKAIERSLKHNLELEARNKTLEFQNSSMLEINSSLATQLSKIQTIVGEFKQDSLCPTIEKLIGDIDQYKYKYNKYKSLLDDQIALNVAKDSDYQQINVFLKEIYDSLSEKLEDEKVLRSTFKELMERNKYLMNFYHIPIQSNKAKKPHLINRKFTQL